MATKTKKPAATKPAAKPANKEVTLQDVADKLGVTDTKSLRARIRRIKGGGSQVGKGGRYGWKSFNDPSLKALMKQLKG